MNKLFGLFLLALACWVPTSADAAARFAVCTSACTWDNTSTAMWSTSSGGATGASAPGSGDTVTFDGATCVGGVTCTITTFAGTITAQTITWGACTASTTGCIIDASINNTNFTLNNSGGGVVVFNGSGSGTRKWLSGTGTYNLTTANTNAAFNFGTTTNDQGSVFSGATWAFTSTTANTNQWPISVPSTSISFGPTTITPAATGKSSVYINGSGNTTFSTLTMSGPITFGAVAGATVTVTGALTITGNSSSTPSLITSIFNGGTFTLSIGAASAISWTSFREVIVSGAGGLTATNCLDFGRNTISGGNSCTAPSGGGGGGRIIGG